MPRSIGGDAHMRELPRNAPDNPAEPGRRETPPPRVPNTTFGVTAFKGEMLTGVAHITAS
jgi:hypothetical protein